MLVNCKGCGNKIDKATAFNIVIKGKNNYYCNEEEYKKIEEEKTNRLKVIEVCNDILGNTTNTILFKELKEIANVHTYTKIYMFLEDKKDKLIPIMNKGFNNEFGKIKYFTTIIKNKIGDYKEEIKIESKKANIETTEVLYKPKQRKKTLNEYLQEYKE